VKDVDAELDFHIAETVDALVAQGWTDADARAEAERRFGDRGRHSRRIAGIDRAIGRRRRLVQLVEALRLNARDARRALRASPLVSLVAIVSLALGIGANTAIFSILNALLWQSLPVTEPHRLALMMPDAGRTAWTGAQWQVMQTQSTLVEGTLAFAPTRFNLSTGGQTDLVDGLFATGSFFEVLGVDAVIGRPFSPQDDVPGGGGPDGPVALIGYRFWQQRYGGATSVIGQTLTLERVPFTIVGVTPRGFNGPEIGRTFDIVVPLRAEPLIRRGGSYLDQRGTWWLTLLARLKRGQTTEQAAAAWNGLKPQIRESTMPEGLRPANQERYLRAPFVVAPAATGTSALRRNYTEPLRVMLAGVGLVLLIACANIANLLLARVPARRRELSIRMALGASRMSLGRQLLLEGLLLSTIGAAVGLLVAKVGSRLLVRELSTYTSHVVLDVPIDGRVLTFTVLLSVLITVVFAAAPTLRALRVAPSEALKEEGRGIIGDRGIWLTQALLAAQVAVSVVLLVAAGLFVGTFVSLAGRDAGFDRDKVLVATVNASRSSVAPQARPALYTRLREAAAALPGVASAAVSPVTPASGDWAFSAHVPGARSVPEEGRHTFVNVVTPDWFKTYGTRLTAGRDFTPQDTAAAPRVAIVNEAFVRHFIGEVPAIGQVIEYRDGSRGTVPPTQIVGVARDAVYRSLREQVPPVMYLPMTQRPNDPFTSVSLSVRVTTGNPAASIRSLSAAIGQIDPDLTFTFRSLRTQLDATLTHERILAMVSGFFGVLALLLAACGLYGVAAYSVSRRRAEIALRLALGAKRAGILRMVFGRLIAVVLSGTVIGALVSMWLGRYVSTLIFGLTPHDPLLVLAAAGALLLVGILGGSVPARRAASLDPASVLREG